MSVWYVTPLARLPGDVLLDVFLFACDFRPREVSRWGAELAAPWPTMEFFLQNWQYLTFPASLQPFCLLAIPFVMHHEGPLNVHIWMCSLYREHID